MGYSVGAANMMQSGNSGKQMCQRLETSIQSSGQNPSYPVGRTYRSKLLPEWFEQSLGQKSVKGSYHIFSNWDSRHLFCAVFRFFTCQSLMYCDCSFSTFTLRRIACAWLFIYNLCSSCTSPSFLLRHVVVYSASTAIVTKNKHILFGTKMIALLLGSMVFCNVFAKQVDCCKPTPM